MDQTWVPSTYGEVDIVVEAGQYENCFAVEVDQGQLFHVEYSVKNSFNPTFLIAVSNP